MNNDENIINMNVQFANESVNYFLKQGKIKETQYNQISGVTKALFKTISESIKNYNTLHETMRVLKKELNSVKHEYEAANLKQAKTSENTEKLSRALKAAEVGYDSQKASFENLSFESEELEKEVMNREQRMRDDFRIAEEKMQPMIDHYNAEIQNTRAYNEKISDHIESLQKNLEENMHRVNTLRNKTKELLEEEEKLKEMELKIKDSPDHYAKSAENLHIEIVGMNNEIKDIRDEIERKRKILETFKQKKKLQEEEIQRLAQEKDAVFAKEEAIETEIDSFTNQSNKQDKDRGMLKVDGYDMDDTIKGLTSDIKSLSESINKFKKEIERIKKHIKKEEISKHQCLDVIQKTEGEIENLRKDQARIHNEMRNQ